ncbi:FH2 domain-containing protein 1 [Eucyclogobius newberryi]|uniref:FH2 domain-containing protein 1 n=1 Tax=Eucyclogobius newberryi TaxID=166745 RepID=UPI003B5BD7CB
MSVPSVPLEPESSSSEASSSSASATTTSDSSKHAAAAVMPPAPPALPAPPPPPGAPPPPALPGGRKKRRVRSFFWKPIPEEKVRGRPNIWTMAVQEQQFQIDVRSVEELFGQQEDGSGRGPNATAGASTQVSRARSFKESAKGEISILDSKRGMNVGIFLRQFKKSNRAIVEDIGRGAGQTYGAELLKDLLKLLPDAEEVKKLRAFKGDPNKLALVDSFMYLLIQVPRFELRIEAMVLRGEFFPSCAAMSNEINVVRVATKELMGCEELHAVLHLVLQAGNIMNAGGYAGNAVGFKLSSLLSLADTKANKPGMNLLHFVAMEAKKKDEKLLKFPEKLHDVQSAARISVENIETEFSSLYVRIRTLEEKVQGDQELTQQLGPFLQSAAQTLQDLKRRRLDLRKEGNSLIDFFCEDKDTFKLDECFRIFQDFCHKFKKAVKDNTERELKEVARQRRLRELEERRSAWSGPDQSGGFGRSSSETDVDMLTKEGLLEFFHRAQSPHSPLSRSASARRHRHAVTTTADRQLKGYLEVFGHNDNDLSKFNSLPRSGRPHQRRTAPWMLGQDDNRELGWDRLADAEPVSPLARFSSTGLNDNTDPYGNNNQYSSVSEGSALPRPFCVFQKAAHVPNTGISGQMNVSVEKHTLVRGPQPLELPSPNNNSSSLMHFLKEDIVVTNFELDKPQLNLDGENKLIPKPPTATLDGKSHPPQKTGTFAKDNEEFDSTISSTTCDTPLPFDPPVSNKAPMFYIIDCTETDCSVTLDYSETDLFRTGRNEEQDPSSVSSNLELSTSDTSAPNVADANFATQTEEWDTESAETTEGKQAPDKETQIVSKKQAKGKAAKASKNSATSRGVRTLTSNENQGMRRVVPISKVTRSGSSRRGDRQAESTEPRRALRDQSTPARSRSEKATRTPRHSSMPPEETKAQRGLTGSGSRWTRESTPRKATTHKPSAKPLRNIPKPEEKMCRSTMRALAQAQAQTQANSENSSPNANKSTSGVPSFARNTVAFSSRSKKEPSTPSLSPSVLSRQVKPSRPASSEERPPAAGLRRVQSVKATSRSSYRSETPPPPAAREDQRKTSSSSERSYPIKDLATGRSNKPTWK